jgi:hypothetical protein
MADAMRSISSAARLSGSAGPTKRRTQASELASGGLQLNARRRARKLDVRHDPPALPGRSTRFHPRRLHHHRMHVIARHQLGYGTQAGIRLQLMIPVRIASATVACSKSGTDQSGCPGKAHRL